MSDNAVHDHVYFNARHYIESLPVIKLLQANAFYQVNYVAPHEDAGELLFSLMTLHELKRPEVVRLADAVKYALAQAE